VTLTFCWDLSAADWIAHSDLPWSQLVGFGPARFDAYARLRFLPDPAHPDQSENDVEAEYWRTEQLPRLFEVLATHTATPEDCSFYIWEGYGPATPYGPFNADDAVYIRDPDARPAVAPEPAGSPSMTRLPKVVVPHRAYWLFRGPLAELRRWDTAQGWPGECRLDVPEPAFVWPRDHAWCVAKDVDPLGRDRRTLSADHPTHHRPASRRGPRRPHQGPAAVPMTTASRGPGSATTSMTSDASTINSVLTTQLISALLVGVIDCRQDRVSFRAIRTDSRAAWCAVEAETRTVASFRR
jgi:hypothetical protein